MGRPPSTAACYGGRVSEGEAGLSASNVNPHFVATGERAGSMLADQKR